MVLTSALFLMSFAIHDAHAASRSAWRQHGGDEVGYFSGWGYNIVLLQNWANYPNLVNNGARRRTATRASPWLGSFDLGSSSPT